MNGISKSSMPSLVVFSAFYDPFMTGGAERMVHAVVPELGKNYELTLITARLDRKLPRVEKRNTYTIIRLGVGSWPIDKLLYPLLASVKARRYRPRIIHAIMESYAAGALYLAKWSCPQAKRILTLQSGDLDSEFKQRQWLLKIFWKKIHRSPDFITAISSFLADRARQLGVVNNKIKVIPNGVDLSEVPDSEEKVNDRVICVARLSWEKGLDYLVKAWPEVLQQIPSAQLVLVGEGDKRKEIEGLINKLNIDSSVELLGNMPHNQVLAEIKKSEVFICPSLAEGLGNVFIEAQACGVVPIGTRVGGIPDVIQNEENGLLINPEDSDDIAQAIIKLLSDKELNKKLSANALASAKKYDWPIIIKQFDDLYNRLMIKD